jgi:predicted regulator of Ras-like GTPase activity (Roadblock/LC7/MglB family)
MEKLVNILASMSSEVQGFVAGAVVDKEEGLTIAEYKADPNFEVAITAAYSVELLRAQRRAMEAMGESEDKVEIFSFTPKYIFISKIINNTPFYMHIVLKREKAILGLVFAYIKKYENLLDKAIKEWQSS